jgi:hypothetical protein
VVDEVPRTARFAVKQETLSKSSLFSPRQSLTVSLAPVESLFASYEYQPLVAERDIRLAALQPDPDDQDPRLEIGHYSLDSCPKFYALSYVWGPPEPRRNAKMNGFNLPVRENLWTALKRVRQKTGSRVALWWVDRICIYSDRS